MSKSNAGEASTSMQRTLRYAADRICLWCLCGDSRCFRAKACRGDVRACGKLALDWLAALDEEMRTRPDFAEIERRIGTAAELSAYRAWRKLL